MIQFLQIQNYLHVQRASLSFSSGLHCITGESGAGKTVILKALKLILGEKGSQKEVHLDANEAIIEAAFDIGTQPKLLQALEEAGIRHDKDEWLVIKRIIPKEGRSRQFINSQHASLFLLETIGQHLIEIVSQHAGKQLFSSAYQRALLDEYGSYAKELSVYKEAYQALKSIEQEIESINEHTPEHVELLIKEKEVLDELSVRETDIDDAVNTHMLYSSSKELAEVLSSITFSIDETLAPTLLQLITALQKLPVTTKELDNLKETLQQAQIALSESSQSADTIQNSLSFDDEAFHALNRLMETLASFKRRYNITYEGIHTYYDEIQKTITAASEKEFVLEQLRAKRDTQETKVSEKAQIVRSERKKAAQALAKAVTTTLHTLKMDGVTFAVHVDSAPLSESGADCVYFTLQNPGSTPYPIKEIASGGELSRILLAVKSHIAERKSTPTLVFDEVDANIGGETATTVGKLLTRTAMYQQLICITHFAQVAKQADHIISVEKTIKNGKHEALIELLDTAQREKELLRMQGATA